MKLIFLIIATVVTAISTLPYLIDIVKRKTKPNIVSWITWTLLTGIAAGAEIAAHEYVAAIFMGSVLLETFLVVVLGLKFGFVKYTAFDVVCQIGALVGIVLWQRYNSPTIGVISAVTIDLIGGLPTLRHSWLKPFEETWTTYILTAIGGMFALLALKNYNWVSVTYAAYIVLFDMSLGILLIWRRQNPAFAKARARR